MNHIFVKRTSKFCLSTNQIQEDAEDIIYADNTDEIVMASVFETDNGAADDNDLNIYVNNFLNKYSVWLVI